MLAGTPAGAADVAADNAEGQSSAGQLGDIVITARRISENVQTTPVSVSAVSLEDIRELNITRLSGLQQLAPNLSIVENGPSSVAPLIFIRGIGSPSVALYSEPPVGLYIDGVYTPRPTGAAFDLPDLAGAEVLRGPQGTLFGRNTTGGAILLRTETPRADAGGRISLSYGSNNDFIGSAVLHTGTLGDTGIRAKLVLQDHDRDGWVHFPGYDDSQSGGSLHSKSVALTLASDVTDKLSIENAVSYSRLRSAVGWQTLAASPAAIAYFNQSPGLGGPPFLIGQTPLDLTYRDPRATENEARIKAFSERLTIAFDGGEAFKLKSITAYSRIDENLTGQLGGSYVLGRVNRLGVPTIGPVITHVTPSEPGHQRQFSQEFNATGGFGDFSYVAGLYYFQESVGETIQTLQIGAPSGALAAVVETNRSVIYSGKTRSYAAYGQVSYKPGALDERLEISGGLRYTKDKKSVVSETLATSSATGITTITGTSAVTGLPASGPTGINPSSGKDNWSNVGWSASASYQITPRIYAFARASSAFRAGGFNAGSTNAPSYDPETAVSYEAGIKSELFDRHLRLNLVGYHTDYDGLQINQYFGPPVNTNFITNAGSAKYDGFEIEATAALGHGFSFTGDIGRIYPKYKTYLIGASPRPALCTATPNDPSCFQNVANVARFGFLSRTTYHVGGQYESPETPVGVFTVRADYSYKSSFRFGTLDLLSPNNTSVASGAAKDLSARIILSQIPIGGGDIKFNLQAFAENLLDNRYIVEAVDFSTTMNGIFNRPRNFGIILSAEF